MATTPLLANTSMTTPSSGAPSVPVRIWHRVGGRYSDQWHRIHLLNPARRSAGVQHARLPLARSSGQVDDIEAKMKALRKVGVPYTDAEIAGAKKAIEGKTELEALIAYLQGMGTALKQTR
jgi:cytochrome c oxidase cbb3-type subunit 2